MDDDGSWQMSSANLGNTSMGIVPNCNPGVDSFCSTIWEGFGDANLRANLSSSSLLGAGTIDFEPSRSPANGNFGPVWNPPIGMFKGPQFLPQFQVDSGLIDRAARFSCFSGGNMSDMMNPFSTLECMNSHSKPQDVSVGNDKKSESIIQPRERAKEGEIESDGFECSDRCGQDLSENAVGQSSAKGLGSKKRKRNGSRGVEAANEQTKMPGGENEKQAGSQTSDPRKEEYIHVRARRGQATNSHSLAERVRREKISERMKFLQDLVPGCNKVIGKAVMLDEMINYVQSLQRQVEFLSMKLATINPRLDFNADVVFPKDISRAGPSSSLAFPPDMAIQYPPVHPLQPMLIRGDLPGLETSGGALHRTINSQLTKTSETNKDPTSKVSNSWNDELHNVFQTGFNSAAPLSSQYTSSLPPDDHMKTEP